MCDETTLSFDCQFALGLDWLQLQNPSIDWASGTLKLSSALDPVMICSSMAYSHMAVAKSEDSLVSFASTFPSSAPCSVTHNHSNTAPGEQPSPAPLDTLIININIVNTSTFCLQIEEGPTCFQYHFAAILQAFNLH